MRQRGSTSTKSSQSAASDAVLALARLLARQAAREVVASGLGLDRVAPGNAESEISAEK